MPIGKTVSRLSLATLLLISLATAAVADSDSDSDGGRPGIVGSWQAVSILEPTGQEAPGLFTFNRDRTWLSSGDNAFFSNGHGAWKRTGRRSISGTGKAFVLAETGGVSLIFTNRVEIEVSSDGASFTAVFTSVIALPNGTVVDTVSGTATAFRIVVD